MFDISSILASLLFFQLAPCPPITNNHVCTSSNNVKNVTRFDTDGDCRYDKWIYVYCDGYVVVTDEVGVLTGQPVGRISATNFNVGSMVYSFNPLAAKWDIDIPIEDEYGAVINHIAYDESTNWIVTLK